MRKILTIAAVLMFLAGIAVLVYPMATEFEQKREYSRKIENFEEEKRPEAAAVYPDLLASMQEYNRKIFQEGQAELKDAFSYEDSVFDLQAEGIQDSMIGYLTVDAMGIRVPLYLGASREHLREGASVLGQTSMPVGGENTNCVIAGHRGGYYGDAMFRDIELLKTGDPVILENLWGKLEYRVVKIIVIEPDDIEAVKIVPGEDLLTLVTCHPYGYNYQRYVVYCARSDSPAESEAEAAEKISYEGIAYTPSQSVIRKEKLLAGGALAGAGIAVILLLILAVAGKRRKR